MNTLDSIKARRSIRAFKSDSVSKEIVEDILNCGRLAPSAKNRQPWYFVITSGQIKDKIADMMISFTLSNDDTIERKNLGCPSSVSSTAHIIKQAPILVLIFREDNENWVVGDNLSIGACVENMCLRATELGIGTLWIRDTVYVQKDVASMLGHSDLELNCALLLGVSDQNPIQRPRKELKDITQWYGE